MSLRPRAPPQPIPSASSSYESSSQSLLFRFSAAQLRRALPPAPTAPIAVPPPDNPGPNRPPPMRITELSDDVLEEILAAPDLSCAVGPTFAQRAAISVTRDQWLMACGTRPMLKEWRNMKSRDKYRLLHGVAAEADDDADPEGNYLTPYGQMDIDDVLARNQWSVEHVVPRSHINGNDAGPGENDPNGWIEATRTANSRRSNHPLYLWLDPPGKYAPPNRLVRVDGELHYVPPTEQRGRLARKWLFIRATYADDIQPPTKAQFNRRNEIIALAKNDPIYAAERRVNEHYRSELGWANPLLEDGAGDWYDDPKWRALVFTL